MPWLIKNKESQEEELFFVHVPRCGGTSLMHHFNVPKKVMQGKSFFGKFGMFVFFQRYKLLESANFPFWTWGNFSALVFVAIGASLLAFQDRRVAYLATGVLAIFLGLLIFASLTFIFTAPVIGRIPIVHRGYLLLVQYILCRMFESTEWCTGSNIYGYLMHLTAHKLLAYQYVTVEQMNTVCTMAIVRSPYSRMVSMYNYNKFPNESFPAFCKSWRKVMRNYQEFGLLEEWYTPCHAIPQFEYTHYEGRQLVRSIVKQEELKYLKTEDDRPKAVRQDSTVADLPDLVRDALLGMPRMNQRKTAKKWFEYYDQETLDLVFELYAQDFTVFKYSPVMEQRPDLKPPAHYEPEQERQPAIDAEQHVMEGMLRDSTDSSEVATSKRRDSILRSSLTPVQMARPRSRSTSSSFTGMTPRDLTKDLEENGDPLNVEQVMAG